MDAYFYEIFNLSYPVSFPPMFLHQEHTPNTLPTHTRNIGIKHAI